MSFCGDMDSMGCCDHNVVVVFLSLMLLASFLFLFLAFHGIMAITVVIAVAELNIFTDETLFHSSRPQAQN